MKFVATIEVRMGSSRYPGKALVDIAGKPLLERVVDRIRLCKKIDDIVIATTVNPLDDAIESLARRIGVACYRGSEDDVLDRVVRSAEYMHADVTVQFGGDSPFIDFEMVDDLIQLYLDDPTADLITNSLELTYPLGVYTYVVPMKVMKLTANLAKNGAEREDVTRYIWEHPEKFRLVNRRAPGELNRPELRLTVDYKEDVDLTRKIYEGLSDKGNFTTMDVIHFLDRHPELKAINKGLMQKSAPHLKASQKVYKSAIIGCGSIAGGFDERSGFKHIFTHAGAYKEHARFDLTAIADTDRARLKEFQGIWHVDKAYEDYRSMLDNEPVELVSICAPDHLHASAVRAALNSKTVKCIFEEKPIAADLAEAIKLNELCKAKNISLFLNYNRLWDPLHHAVKRMISEGFLGEIESCLGYYVRGIKHNGTTMINTLRFLLDADISHAQSIRAVDSSIAGDIALDGVLKLKNGVSVFLIASDKAGYGHSIFEIDIIGGKGRIRIMDNGYKAEIYKTAEYRRYPGVRELVPDTLAAAQIPESKMDKTPLAALDEIALSLDRGIPNYRYADEAVKDMCVAEALVESVKRHGAQISIEDILAERKSYV